MPPTRSRSRRSVTPSNSRGSTETVKPICWHRRTRSSSAPWGIAEKLTTTWLIECSSMAASRPAPNRWPSPFSSMSELRIGIESGARPSISIGSSSRNATGRRPNSGRSISRSANWRPTVPAPTIRVLCPCSPSRRRPHLDDVGPCPGGEQVGAGEEPDPRGLGCRIRVVEDQHPHEGHRHRHDRGDGEDRAGVLEEVRRERGPVDAGERERCQHGEAEDDESNDVGRQARRRSGGDGHGGGDGEHRGVDAEGPVEGQRIAVAGGGTAADPCDVVDRAQPAARLSSWRGQSVRVFGHRRGGWLVGRSPYRRIARITQFPAASSPGSSVLLHLDEFPCDLSPKLAHRTALAPCTIQSRRSRAWRMRTRGSRCKAAGGEVGPDAGLDPHPALRP